MTTDHAVARHFISADQLLTDSFRLAMQILASGFRPTHIVGIWRGGTPVGIAVQELFAFAGIQTDHIAIRTSLYEGIAQAGSTVRVHGLEYIVRSVNAEDALLIVDDVYDSGRSIRQVIADLRVRCRRNTPEIRTATVYYKPGKALPLEVPHYYLHETDRWLVFPHELAGLSVSEILTLKPGLTELGPALAALRTERTTP